MGKESSPFFYDGCGCVRFALAGMLSPCDANRREGDTGASVQKSLRLSSFTHYQKTKVKHNIRKVACHSPH